MPRTMDEIEEHGLSNEHCEHGMSADLCEGPMHYPSDDQNSYWEHASTSEIMRETSFQYHQRGENCPWDCGSCPGNIEADEMEARMSDPKYGLTNPVKCGRCSKRGEPVYHEGPAGVRACSLEGQTATLSPPDDEPLFTEPEPDLEPEPAAPAEKVYDGIYTVESAEGHRTLRVRTQDADDKFAPGKQVLAYLHGPDNDSDYTGFAFLVDGEVRLWNRFKGQAALLRDAEALVSDPSGTLQAAHCDLCHRTLTVPASIYNGRGPECAKKGR